MFKNYVSFKNSRALAFTTTVPFSIEKLNNEWTVVVDLNTKETISFKSSEVVTIASSEIEQKKTTKKSNIKTAITEE